MKNADKFLKEAKQGIVTVVFTKIGTGETRVMPCTLKEDLIPAKAIIKDMDPNSDNLVVWSLDKDAWRSFRVNTVIEWYHGREKKESDKGSSN